jgi:hypothetical protein
MRNRENSSQAAHGDHGAHGRLLAWLVGLLVAFVLLRWLGGDPRLAPPAFTEPSSWSSWASSREPLDAVFALARAGLVAVDLYLLAITVLGLLVRWTGAVRAAALLDWLTIPAFRPVLQSVLGMSLAMSTVTSPAVALAAPHVNPPPAVVGHMDAPPPPDPAPSTPPGTRPAEEPPLLRRLPITSDATPEVAGPRGDVRPSEEKDQAVPASPGAPRKPPPPAQSGDPTAAPRASTWEVAPGDHFWSIAERTLAEHLGSEPDVRAVTSYWKRLIARNRDTLVDPTNPDLILPGQVFVLPSPDE